jgi:hypothetical protein
MKCTDDDDLSFMELGFNSSYNDILQKIMKKNED